MTRPDDVQLRTALAQLAGGVSGKLGQIHEQLLLDLADLEAGLDFVEEDIDFISRNEFTARLNAATEYLQHLLDQTHHRWHGPAGPKVVIAGQPNAGKSTPLQPPPSKNRPQLRQTGPAQRATTCRAPLELNGLSIELVDTAGREEIQSGLDRAAQQASEDVVHSADLVLWCSASDAPPQSRSAGRATPGRTRRCWPTVPSHHDQTRHTAPSTLQSRHSPSAASPEQASMNCSRPSETVSNRRRPSVRNSLARRPPVVAIASAEHSKRSIALNRWQHTAPGDELIALEIREALEQTGRIAGRVYTDDLLDRIFSRFCIGK